MGANTSQAPGLAQANASSICTDEQMRRVRLAKAMFLASVQNAEDEAEKKRKAEELQAQEQK